MPSKTLLLTWELGGGMGHVMTLGRLAARLRSLDLRVVAVVKDPGAAAVLSTQGIEIASAPRWPSAGLSTEQIARTSSASIGDILATAGLADAEGLRRLLGEWDAVFSRFKPDLIVANMAPASAIVARGRVPLIQVGDGYTLPPAGLTSFPPLHALSDAGDERIPLNVLNTVLRSRGEQPFDALPQIFSGSARFVFSFPLLDPYAAHRSEPHYGPLLDYGPIASRPNGRAVFAYMSRGYPLRAEIAEALLPYAQHLRVHAPELSDHQVSQLIRAGAIVDRTPSLPGEALASSSLVVHLGGSGLAAEALMAGIPQMILSMQVEQWLTGSALQGAGLGRAVAAFDPGARIAPELDAIVDDAAMAARAADAGCAYREFYSRADGPALFEQACRQLLGA